MAETTTIQIHLTREQELQIAAATGLLVGTLEVELTGAGKGEIAVAQIPEAVVDASLSPAPEDGPAPRADRTTFWGDIHPRRVRSLTGTAVAPLYTPLNTLAWIARWKRR